MVIMHALCQTLSERALLQLRAPDKLAFRLILTGTSAGVRDSVFPGSGGVFAFELKWDWASCCGHTWTA